MIYFSPMEKSKYVSHGIGIGKMSMTMVEWNLAALSSRCLFSFENRLSAGRLAGDFDSKLLKAIKGSIFQTLGGKRVSFYMGMATPWLFYEALEDNDHGHLKINKFHRGGLKGLVRARCLVWDKANKISKLTKDEAHFIFMHSQSYQK
jgi:hypothetical protein